MIGSRILFDLSKPLSSGHECLKQYYNSFYTEPDTITIVERHPKQPWSTFGAHMKRMIALVLVQNLLAEPTSSLAKTAKSEATEITKEPMRRDKENKQNKELLDKLTKIISTPVPVPGPGLTRPAPPSPIAPLKGVPIERGE